MMDPQHTTAPGGTVRFKPDDEAFVYDTAASATARMAPVADFVMIDYSSKPYFLFSATVGGRTVQSNRACKLGRVEP
jgi:hypothetical protein